MVRDILWSRLWVRNIVRFGVIIWIDLGLVLGLKL